MQLVTLAIHAHYGIHNPILYRRIAGICGFSRETVIAVTTNICSRLFKFTSNAEKGLPPEHPRSSSSDDVECFFSVMRDLIGQHFTLKKVQFEWRKLCTEYAKRMDIQLPYFYYTAVHDRFYEGDRPNLENHLVIHAT